MSDEENREKEINLGRKKKEIQEAGDLYKADLGIYKDVAVFFFFGQTKTWLLLCAFPVIMPVQPCLT